MKTKTELKLKDGKRLTIQDIDHFLCNQPPIKIKIYNHEYVFKYNYYNFGTLLKFKITQDNVNIDTENKFYLNFEDFFQLFDKEIDLQKQIKNALKEKLKSFEELEIITLKR